MRVWLVVLIVVLLACVSCSPTATQDPGIASGVCAALSDADCAILTGSYGATSGLQSARFTLDTRFAIENMRDAPDVEFTVLMEGAYDADWSAAVAGLNIGRIISLIFSAADRLAFAQEVLDEVGAQVAVTMTGSEALVAGSPRPATFRAVLAGGTVYVDFNRSPAGDETGVGWIAFDIVGEVTTRAEEAIRRGAFLRRASDDDATAFAADFVTVTRLPDETGSDGATLAVYASSLDVPAMLQSPEMAAYVRDSQPEDTPDAVRDAAVATVRLLSTLAYGLDVTLVQKIDPETLVMREAELQFSYDTSVITANFLELLSGVFTALLGEDRAAVDVADDVEGAVFSMTASMTLDDLDAPQDIVAPDDSELLTLLDVVQFFADLIASE